MDWEAVSKELAQPLDPSAIKPPPQGKFGEYVDGYHVVTEANRIFGRNGWSYTITSLDMVWRTEVPDRNGNAQVRVAWKCTVRVDVGGVIREGAAVGTGMSKPENEGDAHESAVKEAETDALKRALRCFGNTFGLALYEKDKSKREVGKPFDAPSERDRMLAAIRKQVVIDTLTKLWAQDNFQAAFKQLPEPMQNELKKAKSVRVEELMSDPIHNATHPHQTAEEPV